MSRARPDGCLRCDEPTFGRAADRMVRTQLAARGIGDRRVLEAMRRVPRHRFVDRCHHRHAYADRALPTIHDQTISQPYMVALMTEQLAVGADDHVLEVGTGSGYQTMILALIGRSVVTVERDAALSRQARQTLGALGIRNVRFEVGDGTLGAPDGAPYDRILVTAGGRARVPAPLMEQLADPGRLVVPLGDRETQWLTTFRKQDGRVHRRRGIPCRFVPLVGTGAWPSPGA